MSDDPNMPKWALDPLLTEASPLREGAGGMEGHGAIDNGGGGGGSGGGGGAMEDGDSEGEYDSEFSDDDLTRQYSGIRTLRRGCLLDSLMLLNAVTVLTALGVAAAQGLVLARMDLSPESTAIRYYTILFCILIIFAELEWTTTVREMFVFNSWIPRGVLYSFVGVLVLEEEDEKGLDLGVYGIYVTVVAWIMVGIGCVYFLMGICCVKRLRDKRMARYKTLVAHSEMQAALRRDHDAIA